MASEATPYTAPSLTFGRSRVPTGEKMHLMLSAGLIMKEDSGPSASASCVSSSSHNLFADWHCIQVLICPVIQQKDGRCPGTVPRTLGSPPQACTRIARVSVSTCLLERIYQSPSSLLAHQRVTTDPYSRLTAGAFISACRLFCADLCGD